MGNATERDRNCLRLSIRAKNLLPMVSAIINCKWQVSCIVCAGCTGWLLQYVAGGFTLVSMCKISGRG